MFSLITQSPTDVYNVTSQQLMMDIVLNAKEGEKIDTSTLKNLILEHTAKITKDEDYEKVRDELKSKSLAEAEVKK
jgi:hypothetical protein